MDQDKFNLGFGGDTNGRLNTQIKQIPEKFQTSDINWGFEVSEGDRPADPFMPNRYAPIVRDVRNVSLFEKGVVIPTGTIISAIPVMNKEYYNLASPTLVDNFGVASGSVESGNIALGIGFDSNTVQGDMEDVIDGYDRIRLVGTIANGGTSVTDAYSAFDYTNRARVGLDGALVQAGDTFARGANIPVGFTTHDVYLFDQGGNINFSEISWNKFSSFATDHFVEMPYYTGNTYGELNDGSNFGAYSGGLSATYTAVRALGMPFFWAPSFADMKVGTFVKPDYNGKWRVENVAANAVSANKTVQTVGKLISFTNKFPGDLEGTVETWYNKNAYNYGKNYRGATSTGGTATYGLEYRLFVFIATILTANGTEVNFTNIKAAINSGEFGIARVNVHTS
jgi:hypothetical protein